MRLRSWLKRLSYHVFASKLPAGRAEFYRFSDDLLETYNLPKENGYYHAIATMIMHLDPTHSHMRKSYFAKSLFKTQSNQVAYALIQEIKVKEAEKEKLRLEAEKNAVIMEENSSEGMSTSELRMV